MSSSLTCDMKSSLRFLLIMEFFDEGKGGVVISRILMW